MTTRRRIPTWGSLVLFGLLGAAGCNSVEPESKSVAPAPGAEKESAAPFVPLDACSLLSKMEVEAVAGKPVMEPHKEEAANLVSCSFGDPKSPQVNGRPSYQVVRIAVFTGQDGAYYAGPVAQAKDTYEIGRKNAASDEPVNDLGEGAYWDKLLRTLNVHKGKYYVSTTVEADAGLEQARKLTVQALERLP
jgi:hypothetical protein